MIVGRGWELGSSESLIWYLEEISDQANFSHMNAQSLTQERAISLEWVGLLEACELFKIKTFSFWEVQEQKKDWGKAKGDWLYEGIVI